MGGGKPQRVLGGKTLLQRAIERARSWECEPVVVSRCDLAADCETIRDRMGIAGPLAGLAGALRALADDRIRDQLGLDERSKILTIGTEGVTDAAVYREIVG